MVGKTISRSIEANQVPLYVERFGTSKDEIFITAANLRKELGNDEFENCPPVQSGFTRIMKDLPRVYAN